MTIPPSAPPVLAEEPEQQSTDLGWTKKDQPLEPNLKGESTMSDTQPLTKATLCGRTATIGALTMGCENHAGHDGDCWYNISRCPDCQGDHVTTGCANDWSPCGDIPPGEEWWPTGERCQLPKGHEGVHIHQHRTVSGTLMERGWHVTESGSIDGVRPVAVLRTKAPAQIGEMRCGRPDGAE